MILGNRRYRILYIALAGMDVACLLPYALTWIEHGRRWSDFPLPVPAASVLSRPELLFVLFWLLMVGYLFVTDLINRRNMSSPQREIVIILLVFGTSVAGVRFLLYPLHDFADSRWLGETVRSILNFSEGVTPPLLFLLINVFLWVRVAMAADRELTFFGVGVSFRLGMLLTVVGASLLSTVGGRPAGEATFYFMAFFGLGLVAVALARIDEKAVGDTHSVGKAVPFARLTETVVLSSIILGSAYTVQWALKPDAIRRALSLLDPLWKFVAWVLATLLIGLFTLVGPILDRLVLALQRIAARAEPVQPETAPPSPLNYADIETVLRDWSWLRYALVICGVLGVIALLWFLFVQSDEETKSKDEEEAEQDEVRSQLTPEMPNFARLRDWFRLLRNYGLSRQLLTAINVHNMYANLGRMARSRGYPRLPAQPPDVYLPRLQLAFPGQNARIERVTSAYMRVHYGDLSLEEEEIRSLRADYEQIRQAPLPEASAS